MCKRCEFSLLMADVMKKVADEMDIDLIEASGYMTYFAGVSAGATAKVEGMTLDQKLSKNPGKADVEFNDRKMQRDLETFCQGYARNYPGHQIEFAAREVSQTEMQRIKKKQAVEDTMH